MSLSRIKLSKEQIAEKLTLFTEWTQSEDSLKLDKTFKNFSDAFCFLTKIALVSETLNHHATIVNTYNNVTLTLSTHDAGGITELDFQWIALLNN